MKRRWNAWGPVLMWAGVLFFLSALPGSDAPPLLFHGEDKLAHFLLYGVLGMLLGRGAFRGRASPSPVPVLLAGFLYAVSDEWHQSFVPGRDPSLGDLTADTVGLLLGYLLYSAISRRRGEGVPASSP